MVDAPVERAQGLSPLAAASPSPAAGLHASNTVLNIFYYPTKPAEPITHPCLTCLVSVISALPSSASTHTAIRADNPSDRLHCAHIADEAHFCSPALPSPAQAPPQSGSAPQPGVCSPPASPACANTQLECLPACFHPIRCAATQGKDTPSAGRGTCVACIRHQEHLRV